MSKTLFLKDPWKELKPTQLVMISPRLYAKLEVENEHQKGPQGRFAAGLPRINDGQLLFVQHFISKLRDDEQGGRLGIVLNGSPLFTGNAGSGESEIRKWIIENDWLETIVQLPDSMFFNTGITTYLWILTNKKSSQTSKAGRSASQPAQPSIQPVS